MIDEYAFGKNVKKRLVDMERTQTWLCLEIDMPLNTMSQYMMGRRMPKAETLYKIAKALNCSMDSLMEGVFE